MIHDPKSQVESTMRALHLISLLLSPSTILDMDAREGSVLKVEMATLDRPSKGKAVNE